jgi:ribonucleotide reductase alpha subunit
MAPAADVPDGQFHLDQSDEITDDRTNADIFETSISEEVYEQNYQYGTDTHVPDTWYRNARYLASVEENQERWTERFYQLLSGHGLPTGPFPFTPGGRIFANAGTSLGKATLINCFVSGFQGHDQDSMDEIQAELTRQAKILASEGGYGFCAHVMRPRGSRIGGVGSMTPGAVQMLDCWNEQAATIVAGSGLQSDRDDVKDKIRKGAQMVTMGVWHPDIIEFIKAKQEPGRLHKFNMSILISDAFMKAVKNDEKWALRFPAFEEEPEFYQEHWDGNLQAYEAKGGTVKTWRDPATGEKAVYDAREIWDLVMDSTYNRNEPGVIFVDTINRENNLQYCEHINATNPCVAEGTLVNTPDGYERVENVSVGDEILTTIGHEPVDEIEVHRDYPVYRVRFSDGGEQLVTAAHRYHVKESGDKAVTDRRLDEIEEGATIRVRGNHQPLDLDESEYERGLKRGVLVGDGCYTEAALESHNRNALAISSSASDAAYNENVQTLFGADHGLDTSSEGKAVKIWVTGAEELVDELNLAQAKAPAKTVDVASMTRSEMLGVLDGLIASDGNMNLKSNHPQLRFMTTSEELAQGFRQMMLSFGAHATISDSGPPKSTINGRKVEGNHTKYTVQVSGESLRNFAQHSRLDEIHPEKGERLLKAQTDFLLSGNYWWAKIESIEEAGTADVYDLYCEKSDTWITSGYVQRGCGEQVLPVGGVCLLGNFNLTQFVDREAKTIDYDLLDELIPSAVRFLDNVNDLSYVPLEEQRRNLQQKRRIGLGHFGDGSALMMMKTRYGSEEGVSVMREFQQHLANKAYQASARLAEEKGAFPLFDKDEYLSNPFVQRLSDETKEMIGDLGLRNSHLLSIQPTGNTSTLANAPSSGIEPVFMHSYIRTSEQPALPDALTAPEMSPRAYSAGDTVDADGTTWAAEEHGDEVVLRCTEEGYTQWQIHPTRGICKDEKVEDYAVRHMKEGGEWDPEADWAVTTRDLDVDDHLRQMEALAPFIDSSMSKCVVEGTRIQTSCGPVRIEEFYDGEQAPDTFSEPAFNAKASDGRGNMQPITKAYYGGEKPCVEVKVRTGETIKCSRTHKLLTPSGWKRASELEKGEPVAINHAPVETSLSLQQVPQPDFSNAISRTFPTHLTETFAKFLGMWFADGSINENSIRVHEKDERVRRVASGLLDELFGECKTQTDCRTGVRTHEIHSRPLAQYFKKHYGGDASEKAPPEELFRSPKSVKKAFLEGLTLDGYVDKTQSERLTVYEGYSKGLRDAAAYLLAELGVRVHLRSKEVSGASSGSDKTFSVRAYLRGDTLEPVESHKREYSTREFGAAKRLVRDPEQYMELPATDHPDYIGLRNLRRSLKRSGVVQKSALDALGVGYDDKLGWSKTTEVRDIGRQPVYDVEVADTHSYRVGNIVSHNTVNVPADYPFGEFKDLYRKAWETGSIKGVTTYRAGTMSAVLSGSGEDEDTLPRTEAPDRPEELPCAIHRVRYRGDHWTVLVGFLEEDPYEVFAFKSEGEAPLFGDPAERIDEGVIRKNESRHYSLLTPEDDVVIDDITSHMPSDEARVETRLVSTALRHGSKVDFLVEQLEKAEGSIASFGRAMAKALSAHAESHEVTCDKCGSSNVRHVEGCMMCADCGHSRCS